MADPQKLSNWNTLADALQLNIDDEFPFLQVNPAAVDPLTGGPGGNDITITAELLAAALIRLGDGALHDLLGYLAFWSPTGEQDAKHVLRGDQTWGKASSGFGAGLVFDLPGAIVPVSEASSPRIPVMTDGTLTDVLITMRVPAPAGMTCVIDVFHNGVSVFPSSKPTMTAGVTLARATLPTPIDVVAFTSTVSAAVLTPAGRGLTIVVGSAD